VSSNEDETLSGLLKMRTLQIMILRMGQGVYVVFLNNDSRTRLFSSWPAWRFVLWMSC